MIRFDSSSLRHRLLTVYCMYYLCFFFSSRRRHTRFKCDWSSDVCSSDLAGVIILYLQRLTELRQVEDDYARFCQEQPRHLTGHDRERIRSLAEDLPALWQARSEEGRVGEEGRSRWAPDH